MCVCARAEPEPAAEQDPRGGVGADGGGGAGDVRAHAGGAVHGAVRRVHALQRGARHHHRHVRQPLQGGHRRLPHAHRGGGFLLL